MNKLLADKKIVIVGGGPGGLSLARLLQMRGGNVMVYERDENRDARISGGSLDLHGDTGQKVIEEAGLIEEFKKLAREGDALRIYDKQKTLLFEAPPNNAITSERPEIDRHQLRNLLLNSLLPETVVWNKHFQCLNLLPGNQYEVCFKDGDKIIADLVIGADGVHSKIRPYITDIKPEYSGTILIQGEVSNPKEKCPELFQMIDNNGALFILGDCKGILSQFKGDGTLVFYITSKRPENWVTESGINFHNNHEVTSYLEQYFEDWDKVVVSLFKAADNFVPRLMYGTPIEQKWETKFNMTIIGDAAHVMPPFAGVGVNMAMYDALELANCLTSDEYFNLYEALKAYEQEMLTRTSEAQALTKNSEDIFHSPTAIEDLLIEINKNTSNQAEGHE